MHSYSTSQDFQVFYTGSAFCILIHLYSHDSRVNSGGFTQFDSVRALFQTLSNEQQYNRMSVCSN